MNYHNEQFHRLINILGTDQVNEILYNWNESELNEEGNEILIYVDSRADGPRTGGPDKVDKQEFIDWLLSDAPFDPEIYGAKINTDKEWGALIDKVRIIVSGVLDN